MAQAERSKESRTRCNQHSLSNFMQRPSNNDSALRNATQRKLHLPWQETLRAMERLVDIFRRATVSKSGAKNPLTAGAAERKEWQYEDADAFDQAEVTRTV